MLWSMMNFNLLGQPPCFFRIKSLVKRGRSMRIEMIHHHYHLFYISIVRIQDLFHKGRPVFLGSTFSHLKISFACERLIGDKHTTHPFPLILVIFPFEHPWLHGKGLILLSMDLFYPLIHTNLRQTGIIRAVIHIQHIFHMIDKRFIFLWWDTILLLSPWFQFIFFNTSLTVSLPTSETIPSSRIVLVNNRTLQCS